MAGEIAVSQYLGRGPAVASPQLVDHGWQVGEIAAEIGRVRADDDLAGGIGELGIEGWAKAPVRHLHHAGLGVRRGGRAVRRWAAESCARAC
jgi:hypothetical protein